MHTLRSIQRSLDLVEERLTETVSINELAQVAGMSLWHFQRTFSAIVGEPVGRYLRRRRIAHAAKRLFDFEGTLLDLALDYQFESHEAFTRAFKADLGVTPSAWREGKGRIAFPRRREVLTQETLDQRYLNMNLLPEIVKRDTAHFIGLQARYIPPTSRDGNNLVVIPALWDEFDRRALEIPTNEPNVRYGLADSLEVRGLEREHPDESLYLAAMRVDPGIEVPEGMTAWQTPGGLYAKFEHQGRTEKIGETIAYIYAKWFPENGYNERPGPLFQRIDHRFIPYSESSVLDIFVPIDKG